MTIFLKDCFLYLFSQAYYNCSCINEGLTTSDGQGDFIDARRGTCDAKCYKLPLFIVFVFSTIVFAAFSGVPNILAIVRYVYIIQNHIHLIQKGNFRKILEYCSK